jgi:hypothetical protein
MYSFSRNQPRQKFSDDSIPASRVARAAARAVSGSQILVEIHPYHSITLYPYAAALEVEALFAHPHLFGDELFDAIEVTKRRLSVRDFVTYLWNNRVTRCHFNTINLTLTPLNQETITLNLLTLLLPIVARLCGCRNSAIVHEADQFFATGVDSCRRHRVFRSIIGRWFIKLFDERYVLAPEVVSFLTTRGIQVRLFESRPLKCFAATAKGRLPGPPPGQLVLSWIGPIVSFRRNWRALLELDRSLFDRHNILIAMLCDGRVDEGRELRAAVKHLGLEDHFLFFDRRPTDTELFVWTEASAGILCLYGAEEYGRTKTSGARLFATALEKPYIAPSPSLALYGHDGSELKRCRTVSECVDALADVTKDRI